MLLLFNTDIPRFRWIWMQIKAYASYAIVVEYNMLYFSALLQAARERQM